MMKASKRTRKISSTTSKKRKHVPIEYDFPEYSLPKEEKILLFKKQYELIKFHRQNRDAPVDKLGAATLGDEQQEPKVFRFQTLIGLMLSSQTRDEITSEAVKRLKNKGGLTIENILSMSEEELAETIKPVGFYKRKANYIKKTSQILKDEYNGDIPDTIEKLCKLPGVGPKMATLCMLCAWKKKGDECAGIGVDVHVHRLSNRLGWVKTKTPEQTQKELEDWMPKEYWDEVNTILVGFGQQRCNARKPICKGCKLADEDVCPYYRHFVNPKKEETPPKKLKKEEV